MLLDTALEGAEFSSFQRRIKEHHEVIQWRVSARVSQSLQDLVHGPLPPTTYCLPTHYYVQAAPLIEPLLVTCWYARPGRERQLQATLSKAADSLHKDMPAVGFVFAGLAETCSSFLGSPVQEGNPLIVTVMGISDRALLARAAEAEAEHAAATAELVRMEATAQNGSQGGLIAARKKATQCAAQCAVCSGWSVGR